MSVNSKMTAIADAIRAKTGGTGLLTLDDMAIEIASITGGGVEINAITASSLPATVVENQIVVITDTTPGTIYVDTNEPANPVSGDVWVQVGSSDYGVEFSETFRNGLIKARQYSSNGWAILAGYVGASNNWVQFSDSLPIIGTPLAEWTWDEIAKASQEHVASSYFEIGDTKPFIFNGITYDAEIVGFDHDDLSDGSGKAGITLGLKNCLNTTYQMNGSGTTSGGYTGSAFYSNLKSTIYNQLPTELQKVIKSVSKKTAVGGGSTTVASSAEALFLYSEVEVFGTVNFSASGEGSQYPKFATSDARIKTVGGVAATWWLRSPCPVYTQSFCAVNAAGGNHNPGAATFCGIAFAFCI